YAARGFAATARHSRSTAARAAGFAPETAAVFLPGGSAPQPGYRLRQPALGRTLRRLQTAGPDDFYRGEIAAALVAASDQGGGLFSAQDLTEHRTGVLEPLRAHSRGCTVYEQPPVSQGIRVLLALAA